MLLLYLIGASLQTGDPAPEFSLPATDGKIYRLEDFRGKLVYLSFLSLDCPPCRQEVPVLNKLVKDNSDNLAVLGVMYGSNKLELAQRTKSEMSIQFPLLYDPEAKIFSRYVVFNVPQGFLISETGKIIKQYPGFNEQILMTDLNPELSRVDNLRKSCAILVQYLKESTESARQEKLGSFYQEQITQSLIRDKFQIASSRKSARFLISGSIAKLGNTTGISIQAIDLLTGRTIFDQAISLPEGDLPKLIQNLEKSIQPICPVSAPSSGSKN